MGRDFGEYNDEHEVIGAFHKYEEQVGGYGYFGDFEEDYMPWFEIFRAGFMAGKEA